MEDENNYMKSYEPSYGDILRRAQQQTVHDLAQQNEAMSLHIEALQNAFDTMVKTNTALLEEKGAMLKHIDDLEAALKRVVSICSLYSHDGRGDIALMATAIKQQFAYLYTEPTGEEE